MRRPTDTLLDMMTYLLAIGVGQVVLFFSVLFPLLLGGFIASLALGEAALSVTLLFGVALQLYMGHKASLRFVFGGSRLMPAVFDARRDVFAEAKTLLHLLPFVPAPRSAVLEGDAAPARQEVEDATPYAPPKTPVVDAEATLDFRHRAGRRHLRLVAGCVAGLALGRLMFWDPTAPLPGVIGSTTLLVVAIAAVVQLARLRPSGRTLATVTLAISLIHALRQLRVDTPLTLLLPGGLVWLIALLHNSLSKEVLAPQADGVASPASAGRVAIFMTDVGLVAANLWWLTRFLQIAWAAGE